MSGIGKRVTRLADAVSRYADIGVPSPGSRFSRWSADPAHSSGVLLGRGIGIEVPFSYYLLFMPIGLIALLLPISISGIGAPQGIIVWLLAPAGVPGPQALALSTLIVLSGIVANLPGAWLYPAGGAGTRLRRVLNDWSRVSAESVLAGRARGWRGTGARGRAARGPVEPHGSARAPVGCSRDGARGAPGTW